MEQGAAVESPKYGRRVEQLTNGFKQIYHQKNFGEVDWLQMIALESDSEPEALLDGADIAGPRPVEDAAVEDEHVDSGRQQEIWRWQANFRQSQFKTGAGYRAAREGSDGLHRGQRAAAEPWKIQKLLAAYKQAFTWPHLLRVVSTVCLIES